MKISRTIIIIAGILGCCLIVFCVLVIGGIVLSKYLFPEQKICYQITGPTQRNLTDQEDDSTDYQIHVLYVVPKDGVDHQYDTNGAIALSVSSWQNWLCNQTNGQYLKLDTSNGVLDITFVRLNSTNNEIESGSELPYSGVDPNYNPYVVNDLWIQLNDLGYREPNKIYAVYYDGSSNYSCGGGGRPFNVAVEIMQGGDPSFGPDAMCDSVHLTTDIRYPSNMEFGMIHELIHGLGFAPQCYPHYTGYLGERRGSLDENILQGHVSDGNYDLMYTGDDTWMTGPGMVLDKNHDDYYDTNIPGCLDLKKSAFLVNGGSELPPYWGTEFGY